MSDSQQDPPVHEISDLLRQIPPNSPVKLAKTCYVDYGSRCSLKLQEITLWCDECDGDMRFEPLAESDTDFFPGRIVCRSIRYRCKHCESVPKWFAVLIAGDQTAIKLGEWRPYGRPLPSKMITLIGPDREDLLKGYRCETQGLGVGAFGYYRRVVENQRNRILDEIIRVAQKSRAPKELVADLETARRETQFSRSMELARDALPPVLLIDGHNPLQVLHSAISEGLHKLPDERCLALATAVREVLSALAQRMSEVLREEKSIQSAIALLLKREQSSPSSGE